MPLSRFVLLMFAVLLLLGLAISVQAQTQTQPPPPAAAPTAPPAPPQAQPPAKPPAPCGPDHAILYKRAVGLLDKADKKMAGKYTAEARALVKEAHSLFGILQKECGSSLPQRELTPQETQQEAINKKYAEDEQAEAERLMKVGEDKEKKAAEVEVKDKELSKKYQKEAVDAYNKALVKSIKAQMYALRNHQMIFKFLAK
jgi:hypothetical protein